MATTELRHHRVPCVRERLKAIRRHVRIYPKDPDPYPDFAINQISSDEVTFKKLSNHDHVTVELRKIAEITIEAERAHIRLLGRITWHEDAEEWGFTSSRIGRPKTRKL